MNFERNISISIVTTLYFSADYVIEFYSRIKKEVEKLGETYEIIFVNDGHTDDSVSIVKNLIEKDPSIKLIELSKNFGHHKAIMIGLEHSIGEKVFLIDIDLEEPPEILGKFWTEMSLSQADVVYGVQSSRKGGVFERISGNVFYYFFNLLSDTKVPKNLVTSRLMNRIYCDNLLRFKEREVFLGGVWAANGFHQVPLTMEKRSLNKSTYSVRLKLKLFVNSITSFSDSPLRLIFNIGLIMLTFSTLFGGYWIVNKLFNDSVIEGWTMLMVSIWFLSGLLIFCVGILGIYLSKIFLEVKQRPYSIIRKIHGRKSEIE